MGGPGAGQESGTSPFAASIYHSKRQSRSLSGSNRSNTTASFFLTSEEELLQSAAKPQRAIHDSTYGVKSLEEEHAEENIATPSSATKAFLENDSRTTSAIAPACSGAVLNAIFNPNPSENSPPSHASPVFQDTSPVRLAPRQLASHPILHMPLVPLRFHSPAGESTPLSTPRTGSLRSFHLSDEDSVADDGVSQAVTSSGDEDDEASDESRAAQTQAPQLVMPCINMPSRRPFTAKGCHMGKLKILIAGSQGAGKTSLINSIVRTCEDIVHVDSVTPGGAALHVTNHPSSSTLSGSRDRIDPTTNIVEIYASSRPLPSWWSDMDDSRLVRRQKNVNEPILDRNISFIDAPGFAAETYVEQACRLQCDVVERQLVRNATMDTLSEAEVLSMLSGAGGVQIDVVLYVLSEATRDTDIEVVRRLSSLTNVIPLLGKSDLYSVKELRIVLESVDSALDACGVRACPLPTSSLQECSLSHEPHSCLTVSSATAVDDENMDASLLMSANYSPPLCRSDLPYLVAHLFEPEHAAFLRHSSAKKFLYWRRTSGIPFSKSQGTVLPPSTSSLAGFFGPARTSSGTPLTSSSISSELDVAFRHHHQPAPMNNDTASQAVPALHPFANITENARRGQHLAHVRLARWAADLQHSLANERERELFHPTTILAPMSQKTAWNDFNASRTAGALDAGDPLGLLGWDSRVRERAWLLCRVLGGCGVVGAVALWVVRLWGVASPLFGGHEVRGAAGGEWLWGGR